MFSVGADVRLWMTAVARGVELLAYVESDCTVVWLMGVPIADPAMN